MANEYVRDADGEFGELRNMSRDLPRYKVKTPFLRLKRKFFLNAVHENVSGP